MNGATHIKIHGEDIPVRAKVVLLKTCLPMLIIKNYWIG